MSRPVVVSVCGDPGGAAALAPVIRTLETEGRVELIGYAYNEAQEVLKSRGIGSERLPDAIDTAWIVRLLKHDRSSLVLTGTSHNGLDWETHFVAAARELGIETLGVLDFWSNYRARFGSGGDLAGLPDSIAVMDERARTEMIAEGIPADAILVTGQPAFDALADVRERFSPEQRAAVRAGLGVAQDDLLVIFASQPLSRLYGPHSADVPSPLGYDQHLVLGSLIDALEAASEEIGRRVTLLIRPHPREAVDDYSAYRSSRMTVVVSAEGDGRHAAMASDLVAGMNTALLVEACYLGCVVISIQPGLRGPDVLPTNRWGASLAVYRAEDVRPTIARMLADDSARAAAAGLHALKLDGKAARRIADRIYASTAKSASHDDERSISRA